MASITLKGSKEIYAAISVLDDAREYGAQTSRAGQKYYLGTANGRGFTCPKDFYDAYKAGTLEQVNYSETSYERKDPNTGDMVKRDSATLGGYLTKDQVIKMLQGDKALVKAEAELAATKKVATKYAERSAYKDLGLNEEEVKELMALA
jgi:hypothetical protein